MDELDNFSDLEQHRSRLIEFHSEADVKMTESIEPKFVDEATLIDTTSQKTMLEVTNIEERDKNAVKCDADKKDDVPKRICVVGSVIENREVMEATLFFNIPVITSSTGHELIGDNSWKTYFILDDFHGPIYDAIYKAKHKILGPPALVSVASSNSALPDNNRPIYNYAMRGVVTSFSGLRKKEDLTEIVHLIHSMGGSIRKDLNHRSTHLISMHAYGDKYRYAYTFRLSIVKADWAHAAWQQRNEPNFSAKDENFTAKHKLGIFEGCRVAFIGFPEQEHTNMLNILQSFKGIETSCDDESCTHKVVNEHAVQSLPDFNESRFYVVKSDWFWNQVADGYAPEEDFLFKDYMQSIKDEKAEQCERRDSLINYSAKAQRKRKRLSRIVLDGTPLSAGKRRSSISDAGILSASGSFIDYTASPDKSDGGKLNDAEIEQPIKKFTMRHNHFMDFYHTESNYVGILETIVKIFKNPLKKMADENPDQLDLLNKSELKSIFSNFLPIYEVHKKMLTRLQDINLSWTEDCEIGQIIHENRDSLLKAYPPYVNFFEQMKETLIQCAQSKPRFQAFLKISQAKPECGRQTLQELMIRPVQRLPSISLLLNDIVKHTAKNNPDYVLLTEAMRTIKEVMTYINEDKRKTEGQKQMFEIFNEIDGCPANLISSNRCFISRCEVTELCDIFSGRGDPLMLFMFTDMLVICKRRSRFHNSKSPSTTTSGKHNHGPKPYKFIKLINLSNIRLLIDLTDSLRGFAMTYRINNSNMQDPSKDRLCAFSISDEEIDKTIYMRNFCKQMAENACRPDPEKYLLTAPSDEIDIDISDVNLGTLSRAFRLATRTRLKVGRAFSFNKTPSRKRTVPPSSLASPYGSNVSLTPSTISSMNHLKLQSSCTAINDYGIDSAYNLESSQSDTLTRKSKNPAGLGRI